MNHAFHAINHAADHGRDKTSDESQLLLIEPFLREQPHLKTYALERCHLAHAVAWLIDWPRITNDWLAGTCGRVPRRTSQLTSRAS